MEFLTIRLQEITGHQLVVTPIYDFLQSLCHGLSQAAKLRIEEFHNKWGSSLYAKNVILGYIMGSWKPPSAARTPEISRQKSWENYASHAFKLNVKTTSISTNSACIGPLTFKEMIQHEFWKDLYNSFGHKVAAFILEKAILVFQVEENFYMLVAAEGCTLHQKLCKATVRPISRNGGGQPVLVNGFFNPYKLRDESTTNEVGSNSIPMNKSQQCATRKRKLHLDSIEQQDATKFHKKVKISASPSSSATPCQNSDNSNYANNDFGIIRWFRPTPRITQFLIEEREKAKQLSGLSNINVKPRSEDTMPQLHFVAILKNEDFCKIARINVVHKQYRPLDFKKEFRTPEWPGLIIKEPEIQSPDRKYNVNVYRISEDFARKSNIRFHVKQKKRGKRRQQMDIDNPSLPLNPPQYPSSSSSHPQHYTRRIGNNSCDANNPPTTILNFIAMHDAVDPFDPLLRLDTLPALYNKSSWSHWPKIHPVTTASSKPLDDGARFLLEDILKTNVGPPNHYLNNSLLTFSQSSNNDASTPFMEILKKVILFHKRVKDTHNLLKRCITFWMIKNQEKIASKACKVEQRHQWKIANKTPEAHYIETIDLTMSTPNVMDKTMATSLTITPDGHREKQLHTTSHQDLTFLTGESGATEFHNSPEITICSGQQMRAIVYSKLKEQIPHSCVLMTLKHILHLSGMEDALGSKKNLRNFYKFLRKSLILAGTKSALQLGQMMAQLESSSCNWMSSMDPGISRCERDFLFAKVVKWIFTNYILTLLKVSFYITEVNTGRLHATFYLRESWKSISESVRHRLIKSGTLSHLGLVPSRPASRRRSLLGINSRIRFLPKRNNDMRPIISLKREARNKWDEMNAKGIIDYIVRKNSPHRLRDTNLLRQRWLKFLEEWQGLNKPKLYFVRGDIQDAYPSVHIPKLKQMLDYVGQELGTMTQKNVKVFSKSRIMFRKAVISWKYPSVWTASIGARPCLVHIDEKHNIMLNPEDVFNKLFPYSNQNVLRIGKHKYDFKKGLPQGWVLSEGYCNIYYGTMDSRHLGKFLKNQGEFFNTSVDDYLYITPNPILAAKFLDKMGAGFPSYNCKFNSNKILTNIYPKVGWPLSRQECEWVTFCGWCFCLTCGHLMRDFGAYVGQDMASSLSFIPKNVSSPENFLVARMKMMLPARLHHFMLDPMINCRARIVLNIWEAGFIFAFRFYAICRVIYPNLNAMKDSRRAKHVTSAIIVCARAVSRITRSTFRIAYTTGAKHIKCSSAETLLCPCIRSYHGLERTEDTAQIPQHHVTSKEHLEEPAILYIVFHAFMLKLDQHSSVFGQEILPRLNKLKQFQQSLISNDSWNFLGKVLGDRMPFSFQNIKV